MEAKRVLVVDDEDDILQALGDFLFVEGHQVRIAGGGVHALKLLKDFKADVVIVDIGMPVVDGYQLANGIRQQLGHAAPPLIALSGYGDAASRERSNAAGFAEHFTKPVEGRVLLDAIARFTGRL